MSSAGNLPFIQIDQTVLDFIAIPVEYKDLHKKPDVIASQKRSDFVDDLLAKGRSSAAKSIGFTAFKEASTIFKAALENSTKNRGNH